MVSAAWVAGFVLILAGCAQPNQQASNSPEATPSTVTTPGSAPTPSDSPTPEASPSSIASPSPAKLIIRSVPFHIGEVGVTYWTVTVVAAGGVKPYKWSISSGALPAGVTLSSAGTATGKPTFAGNFSFVLRVDDAAGGAAGVASSILVFRQPAFMVTKATCPDPATKLTQCAAAFNAALRIPYSGGTPGAKPTLKITSVTGGTIYTPVRQCALTAPNPTTNPPPGMSVSAAAGLMTLSAGPPDQLNWCHYTATITFVLVNPSPCGTGFLCTSSNPLSVTFNL